MRHALLISAAALALAASTGMSLAQKEGGGAPGASGMSAPAGTNAPAANPSGATVPRTGAPGAAQSEPSESPAPKATAPGANRGAQDRTIPEKQKSTQQAPGSQPTQKQGQTEREKNAPGTSTSQRAMTSKNVSLTTEQKSTIRSKVLTSSAPRVEHVDFDIRVGTVVPRTVRVAPLPATILEIEPAWRGFMYFVRGDEIIVVDPRTLEIVAVLDV